MSPESVSRMSSTISKCVVCGSPVTTAADFGSAPAVNKLLSSPHEDSPKFPLVLSACTQCSHGQQGVFVPPEFLFADYLYASGTSKTLGDYFNWLVTAIKASAKSNWRSLLEIGCNDGSFLDAAAPLGLTLDGVDPAEAMVKISQQRGHRTLAAFWPDVPTLPQDEFDVIVAQNVIAHVPNPVDFIEAAAARLTETGLLVLQTSQIDMLSTGQFDTIYHEHYSFFTPLSMRTLLTGAGLNVYCQIKVDIHGGSMLTIAGKMKSLDCSHFQSGKFFVENISSDGSIDYSTSYEQFPELVSSNLTITRNEVAQARARGERIVFVGAAAKAITYLQVSGIKVDMLVDESPFKVGLREPSGGVLIEDLRALADVSGPIFAIVSAWNFREELTRKVRALRGGLPTTFFTYFPSPTSL